MRSFWPWLWGFLGAVLIYRATGRSRGVITDHLEFGRRLFNGDNLYAPYLDPGPLHPVYPPSFGLLTAPFTLLNETLGETAARFAWVTVQMLALYVIGLCLRDLLRKVAPKLEPLQHVMLFVTAVVTLRYILRDTHGGGGNLINLALILGAVRLATADRARPLLAGIVLGFSVCTKPTGILIVPLLWLFGHRRAASFAVLAAGLFLGAALLIHGHGFNPFLAWYDGSVAYAGMTNLFVEPEKGFPRFTWMNQSLRCLAARYTGTVPPEFAAQVPGFFQGLGLPHQATAWIGRGLGLALLATSGWVIFRRRTDPAVQPFQVANVLCLSLLLSPISWKAHHVTLIPACFLLAVHGCHRPPHQHRWPWIFLGAYILICGSGELLVGKDLKNVQQSLYFTTAGTLALWGITLAWCLKPPNKVT
ncbi:MAG: glycosyltransferase family 87 protein [Planctomycetota bacterium]|jgi:hypothetical protein